MLLLLLLPPLEHDLARARASELTLSRCFHRSPSRAQRKRQPETPDVRVLAPVRLSPSESIGAGAHVRPKLFVCVYVVIIECCYLIKYAIHLLERVLALQD